MKTKIILSSMLLCTTLIFNGCSKKGDTGPAGTNGTNGANGNANVIGSNTVSLTSWSSVFENGITFEYSSTITWGYITQSIVDKGSVMAYVQNGSEWIALPFTDSGAISSGYSTTISFSISTGIVKITYSGYDNSGSIGVSAMNSAGMVVRIVAISASNMKKINDNGINIKDYKSIQPFLN